MELNINQNTWISLDFRTEGAGHVSPGRVRIANDALGLRPLIGTLKACGCKWLHETLEPVEREPEPHTFSVLFHAAPIRNGKMNPSNRAIRDDDRPAITGRAALHETRSTSNDSSTTNDNRRSTSDSRSTHRAPRSKSPAAIPNRKSKQCQHGKTKPKKVKPEWLRQTARRIQKSGPATE